MGRSPLTGQATTILSPFRSPHRAAVGRSSQATGHLPFASVTPATAAPPPFRWPPCAKKRRLNRSRSRQGGEAAAGGDPLPPMGMAPPRLLRALVALPSERLPCCAAAPVILPYSW
jgi:hypothetical protein